MDSARPGFLSSFARMDSLGMTNAQWLRQLRRVEGRVDVRLWRRLVGAQLVALPSSLAAWARRRPPEPSIEPRPVVFIVGHWRSGTTFLHHLLAHDRRRFATLPQSRAMFPWLAGTPLARPVLRALGLDRPHKRLFDNVVLDPSAPMELEYALLNLTGDSEYLCWTFPADKWSFLKYLRAAPEQLTAAETARLRAATVATTRGLLATGRVALHKNPPSTATLLELKALFPRAQFVFMKREPASVFRSTMQTMRSLIDVGRVQAGGVDDLEAYVIERYRILHAAYLAQRGAVDPGDLLELSFDALEQDPLAALRMIYERLGWEGFDPALFTGYVQQSARYQKNAHAPLEPALRERLRASWGDALAALDLSL
ncbi:MAG: sulfotransferase [Myxococcales bacterium]|nr:sulfotransferase [Myxococcales bacterium]